MRVFVENFNGVLDVVMDTLEDRGQLTDNPHDADAFVLWQDVRGTCLELARIAKFHLHKPVIVMQHGRGATRDYCAPNNFTLLADKILVWGESERKRLLNRGISQDRISVVGCPMLQRLKPKAKERRGKNILFVPVIAQKEEPENILVYAALKEWESKQLINTIYGHFKDLKRAWAWENNELREVTLPNGQKEKRLWKQEIRNQLPRWLTYEAGLVNVKLSGVHDVYQYQSPVIATNQNDPNLIDGLVELLANTDVMVCLEEGTMQLMACALDIPVIVADIFDYQNYGGCKDYDRVEKIRTDACYWTKNIQKIGGLIDHAMAQPGELRKNRIRIAEEDGGINLGDLNENVIKSITAIRESKELVKA